MEESFSYHSQSWSIDPTAEASSAYQTCVAFPLTLLMRGMVARAYNGIASGSPCGAFLREKYLPVNI